ncbi:MAG: CPBP family intramembrane metalloprotease [Armatimonadetes bacterium]|nr:CPBP family intramembrane metalloprotease [Armatimonadota bacterium]
MNPDSPTPTPHGRSLLILTAWVLMLAVSDLPNMLLGLSGGEPAWLLWSKVGLLAAFLVLSLSARLFRPLWPYGLIFLVFYFAKWVGRPARWQYLLGEERPSFPLGHLGIQVGEMAGMAVVLAVLWAILRRRGAFFLTVGQLNAPLEPVRWLGIRPGGTWKAFGWIFSAVIGGGTLIFIAMGARPLLGKFGMVIGRDQALWLTVVFFGLSHYLYGDPSGPLGFLVTSFVAYLFGKSMLETRGSFWALFMHMAADIPIFAWYALRSV